MNVNPQILLSTSHFVAIDKPSGVTVNRSENEKEGSTIQDWIISTLGIPLKDKNPGEEDSFESRSGIVHRIDKETSGILLIAKTSEAFKNLQSQFFERTVLKKYKTLVHGITSVEKGTINAPVGRLPWNRRKFGVLPEGREAVTDYEKLEEFKKGEGYTFLCLTPHTGRTHQIRIHLKHINHPIVSDPLYAGRKVLREDLKICPRLFLHACYLEFNDPVDGQKRIIESPLPLDLEETLGRLRSD